MKLLKITNKFNNIVILNANHFFLRLRGLIGREIKDSTGLLLTPCDQIHTFFMNVPIDAIYLTKENQVIHIEEQIVPNRVLKRIKGAKKVLELKGGISKKINIKIGDHLNMALVNHKKRSEVCE